MSKYRKWQEWEIEFLRQNVNRLSNEEIARKLNRNKVQVVNALRRYGIKRDLLVRKRFKAQKKWKHEEWAFVVNNFMILTPREMSKIVNHSEAAIQQKLNKAGLFLPQAIREYRFKKAQFNKGLIPWNKGLKGIRMSPRTEFKKGHVPWNTKFDGCITIRDKNRKPYKYIRVSSGKWVLYHRWLWEQHNGPIPQGFMVGFKNGNTLDVRIENLMLISRAENVQRNRNNEKASKTLKKVWAEGRFNLSDRYIANAIAPRDPELRARVLQNKDLLEIKRLQIKLKQTIREVSHEHS